MEPQLVYRGAPVKVHVRLGGIDIASTGRALSDGQYGQTIRIFSNVSSRTLEAVVEGAGVVHLAGF
jgi:flagella basal body P-ring formation protein FlgA